MREGDTNKPVASLKCFQLTGDAFQIKHVGSCKEGKARVLEEKPFFLLLF